MGHAARFNYRRHPHTNIVSVTTNSEEVLTGSALVRHNVYMAQNRMPDAPHTCPITIKNFSKKELDVSLKDQATPGGLLPRQVTHKYVPHTQLA